MCSGWVSCHHDGRYDDVEARVGDVLGRHHELQLRERAVRVGEDRPVLGCVRLVLEATAEQPEELDVGVFQPVTQLGEPLDVVDVPGDGVPLPAPALVEPAEGDRLPAVDVEAGLHGLDAEVADADERGEALQLGRLVRLTQRVTLNTSSYQSSSAAMSSVMWMRWKFRPMVNTPAVCRPESD